CQEPDGVSCARKPRPRVVPDLIIVLPQSPCFYCGFRHRPSDSFECNAGATDSYCSDRSSKLKPELNLNPSRRSGRYGADGKSETHHTAGGRAARKSCREGAKTLRRNRCIPTS